MKLKEKYLKCFSSNIADFLKSNGYEFIHEKDGVYWFKNNELLIINFSNDIKQDIKFSKWINL